MSNLAASISAHSGDQPSHWTAAHIGAIDFAQLPAPALITSETAKPILGDFDLWDIWPLQLHDGSVAEILGGSIWLILSAPRLPDPNMRHNMARIRMLHYKTGAWVDLGNLLPDGLNPGSREWSGSTFYDPQSGEISCYFTAAGRAGTAPTDFEQRLFVTKAKLECAEDCITISDWQTPVPCVNNDGCYYIDLAKDQGEPGHIRGFRDPYWFRDPADGLAYVLFTGSLAGDASRYNGVVGLAVENSQSDGAPFTLLPPIISGDGLVNEMERPHVIMREGLYYVFWSSQNCVFDPSGPQAPTGLYGMVGESLYGPYRPLNGTGLVISNPVAEPKQAYCWQVLDNLDVVSFVDHWGMQGRALDSDPTLNRSQFGGTVAPILRIAVKGDRATLLEI